NIRAVPAPAGSMLAWNQGVLHWGARASRRASAPRCSASIEFQRADISPFRSPLLDPHTIPSFHARLGLTGMQILQYQHMYPLDDPLGVLATRLRDRFLPELVSSP